MWGATMATLQALTAMIPWDCIEYAANNDQGSCEVYLSYPREMKENSNTLEAKLTTMGFSSVTIMTFPQDGNKSAASCVGRMRAKRDDPGYSYGRLGSHAGSLEHHIIGKQQPGAAGGRGGSARPPLQSEQEFDAKTKAVMEATGKKCDAIMERMVTPSALDDKLAPIARKEDIAGMANKEDTDCLAIRLDSMGEKLARSNETIAAYEGTAKAQQAAIKARDDTICSLMQENEERKKKIDRQAFMLHQLREIQTTLAKTEAELTAMSNYRKSTEEMLRVAQVTSDTTIDRLRRDLRRIQQELHVASTKLTDERCAWNNERNKWNDERGYLILAAGNHEDTIITRFRKYIDAYPCGTKRPRTDDDAGDGGRAP